MHCFQFLVNLQEADRLNEYFGCNIMLQLLKDRTPSWI